MNTGKQEENKRNREEGRESLEAVNPFAKSKKIERSPSKTGVTPEAEDMEEIKEMLRKIMEDMEEDTKENRQLRREMEEMKADLGEMERKWEQEKKEIRRNMRELGRRIEEKERKERKINVVITGIQAMNENIERKLEEWMEKEMGVKVEIEGAFKINEGRMILAKLKKWEEKKKLMQSKSKLRGKERNKVYIDNDLTKNEREVQKRIREIAAEKRRDGTEARVGYRKLGMNGRWYKWEEEREGIEWNPNF